MAGVQNGFILEGSEKLRYYPDCPLHTIYECEKLAIPNIFANEGRRENIVCAHGCSGCHVSGNDYGW